MPAEPFTHLVTTEDELRGELYPAPPQRAWEKELPQLNAEHAGFIARSPLAMLATSDAQGRTTVTPRGGPPGFARVLDPARIAWADLTGNNRIDAFRDILQNPQVGLLFMVPGMRETVRVDGTAYLTRDPEILRAVDVPGRTADLALGVHVRTVFLQCGKAFIRSHLWEPESWLPKDELPSASEIIRSARGGTLAETDAAFTESYTERLW